jgi:hypothetical protein
MSSTLESLDSVGMNAASLAYLHVHAFLCPPSDDHMQRLSNMVEELKYADKVPALG